MPNVTLEGGLSLTCAVDDFLWPWQKATPVLMLHGFARNADFWKRWVPAIAESRRVYRPELLGCGRSDRPPSGHRFTIEGILSDLLAVLDAFALERVHWVGESSGGILGLALAAAHPERIASLVLCNTPMRIGRAIRETYALGRENAAAAIRAHGVREWCRRTLPYRLDVERAGEELCAWCVSEMGKTEADVAASLHDCFEEADLAPLLGKIEAPSLLLCGEESPIAAAQQKALKEALAHARLELFAGLGHGVNLIEGERCARVALDFWREVEAEKEGSP